MHRLATAAALLSVALAWPGSASALDTAQMALSEVPTALRAAPGTMCTEQSEVVSLRVLRSQVVALEIAMRDRGDDAAPANRDANQDGPWCLSAEDPRCAPRPSGALPPDVSQQPKLSCAAALEGPRPLATYLPALRPHDPEGDVRDAVGSRLDRPPRTHR